MKEIFIMLMGFANMFVAWFALLGIFMSGHFYYHDHYTLFHYIFGIMIFLEMWLNTWFIWFYKWF